MIARVRNPYLRLALLGLAYPIVIVFMVVLLVVSALVMAFDDAKLVLEDLCGAKDDARKVGRKAVEEIRGAWIGEASPRVGRERSPTVAGDDAR